MNFKTQKFKKENNSKFSLLFIIACLSVLIIPFFSVLFSVNASENNIETIYGNMVRASIDTLYIDPKGEKGGNDANDGISPTTPIQTIERAKELISPTGTIYVMSTFNITQDTVIDMMYPTVELRRYVDETLGLNDTMFIIGSETDSSITPNVIFKNVTIKGVDVTSSTDIATSYLMRIFYSTVVFESGFSIVDFGTGNFYTEGLIRTYQSTIVFNGGVYDNIVCSFFLRFYNETKCIINDGRFTRNTIRNYFCTIDSSCYAEINGGQFGGYQDLNNNGQCDSGEEMGNQSTNREFFYVDLNAKLVINGGDFSYNTNLRIFDIAGSANSTDYVLIINNGYFHHNKMTSSSSGSSTISSYGVVINGRGNVLINGGIFENNTNVNAGGVISFGVGNLVITGGTFRNNSAAVGGVIYCNLVQDDGKTKESYLTISNATFSNNIATGSYVTSSSLNLDKTGTIEGASVIYTTQILTISNCIFNENVVQNNGAGGTIGGVIVYQLDNYAGVYGRHAYLNICDSIFTRK